MQFMFQGFQVGGVALSISPEMIAYVVIAVCAAYVFAEAIRAYARRSR